MQRRTIGQSRLRRRYFALGCIVTLSPGVVGCTSWISGKKKEPDSEFVKAKEHFTKLLNDPHRPRLVGEIATFSGIQLHRYDAFGLVDELHQTGGTVRPGNPRTMILRELRRMELRNPEQVLDSPSTALVKVHTYSFPGSQKGDVLDVMVECSADCNATDLSGGVLIDTFLREVVTVGGGPRTSEDKAASKGELVVLPSSYSGQPVTPLKSIIIGGGRMLQDRQMNLHLNPQYKHTYMADAIQKSINSRFYFNDTSKQHLVAKAVSDFEVQIRLHPKYRFDVDHFSSVIIASGFHESKENKQERVHGCAKLLKSNTTAKRAATELEALGSSEAIEVLLTGLSSIDPEVRFHSAYSLAYLDRKESVPVLVELAKKEHAFRPLCLVGLTVINDTSGRDALEKLLQSEIAELRYGSLWALRNREENSTAYDGERLVKRAALVQIPSGTSQVVVSLQTRPEVVVFGQSASVQLTNQIAPSSLLTLTPMPGNQIRIVRKFYKDLNDPTLQTDMYNEVVASDFVSIMRALTYVGANYNEVVQTIESLHTSKALTVPVAFNPRPDAGRIYKREGSEDASESIKIISVDATTREPVSKSWWNLASWMSKPTVKLDTDPSGPNSTNDSAVSQASHTLPVTDLDQKVKGASAALDANSNSSSDALPDINWDAIK